MSADFNAKSKADLVAEWWATAREAQARVDGSHRMKRPLRDFYRGVAAAWTHAAKQLEDTPLATEESGK